MKPRSYIASLLTRSKALFALAAVLLLLQSLLAVALPLPIRYIIDQVISPQAANPSFQFGPLQLSATGVLVVMSVLVFVLGLLLCVFEYAEGVAESRIMGRVLSFARTDLLSKLLTRRQAFIDSKMKVELLGRVSGDVTNVEILVVQGFPALLRGIPTIVFLIAMMFTINVKFTLIFLVFLPALYLLAEYYTKRMRKTAKRFRVETANFENEAHQALTSLALIKSLNGEEKALLKLEERVNSLAWSYTENRRAELMLNGSFSLSRNVIRGALLFIGCWAIFRGEMTVGDLFLYVNYLETLARPVNELTTFVSKYTKASVSIERINELYNECEANGEPSGENQIERAKLASAPFPLAFQDVTFRYPESEELLRDFSLSFKRHSLIALVGPSGVGKSSFVRLLNRLQDPVSGRILLSGRDTRDFKTTDVRQVARVISQDSYLVSGTIRENLRLASQVELTDEEIWAALRKVNAEEFISGLPRGLDTIVGEGGQSLSGGQMRRLSLARGFLCTDTEVYVFDEPTAGLDPVSAQIVMAAIASLAKDRALVFWATHRIQEVPLADQVLYFKKGFNPTLNTHQELMSVDLTYRQLFREASESSGC